MEEDFNKALEPITLSDRQLVAVDEGLKSYTEGKFVSPEEAKRAAKAKTELWLKRQSKADSA